MDQAKISDDNLANILNSDLDPLLIFAGLFSAILSAFLIEIRKGLQEDLQNITNTLLVILIENQHNNTGPAIPSPSRFEPSSSSRWVNGLWFSSLMFSLMSALGASLAKGWVTELSSVVSGSTWDNASSHCSRIRGFKRWHLKLIIQCLPILIHIGFLLFSVGLVILVWQDDTAIGIVILFLTGLILLLYIGSSIHPTFSSDSPFRTPISGMIQRVLTSALKLEEHSPFPSRVDAQKAQALAWLLVESPNVEIVNAAIRAIAGLPINIYVQDELMRPSAVGLVSRSLSVELAKKSLEGDALSSSLYALLHFVQAVPKDPGDTNTADALRALVQPGGPLFDLDSMTAVSQEVAVAVRGRILLLICDRFTDTRLFETRVPILKASADGHLRRLLVELQLLFGSSQHLTINLIPHTDYLAPLKNLNSAIRHDGHTSLLKAAASDSLPTATGGKFRVATLLHGLTTGSTEVQRQYAKLFSELAAEAAFKSEMAVGGTEKEIMNICSLLLSDDDGIRKHVFNGLKGLAAHGNIRIIITHGFARILERLPHQNLRIFRTITRFLTHIARYADVRTMMVASNTLRLVLGGPNGRSKAAMTVVRKLSNYDDMRRGVLVETVLNHLLGLIDDRHELEEEAMDVLVILADHDDILEKILEPQNLQIMITTLLDKMLETIPKIAATLGDPNSGVSFTAKSPAFGTLVTLAKNDRAHAAISGETIRKCLILLCDPESAVRQSTLKLVVALAQHPISILETIPKIVAMLVDPDSEVRQLVLETVVALAQHNDVRAEIISINAIEKIVTMQGDPLSGVPQSESNPLSVISLENPNNFGPSTSTQACEEVAAKGGDPDSFVRKSARRSIVYLAKYNDVRATISKPEVVHKMITMLRAHEIEVQGAALELLVMLVEYDDVRAAIMAPDELLKIVKFFEDPRPPVRKSAFLVVSSLVQYGDARHAILTPQTMQRYISMLEDSAYDVREIAHANAIAFVRYHDSRAVLSGPKPMQTMVKILAHCNARSFALDIVLCLAHNDMSSVLPITAIIQELTTTLESSDDNDRRWGLDSLLRIMEHDGVRARIPLEEITPKMVMMLKDPVGQVQQSAQEAVLSIMQYADVRAAFRAVETPRILIAMLDDQDFNMQQTAQRMVVVLSQYEDIRAEIPLPESLHTMIQTSASESQHREQSTLHIMGRTDNDDIHAAISTADRLQEFVEMLLDPDVNVQQAALGSIGTLTEHEDGRAAFSPPGTIQHIITMLGDPLCHVQGGSAALDMVLCIMANDELRAMLAMPATIEKFAIMLQDPRIVVQTLGVETLLHLLQHDDMRPRIAESGVILIQNTITMLKNPGWCLRRSGLKIIMAFVQQRDVRVAISAPKIINLLLKMMDDLDVNVQRMALHTVVVFAQYDDIRTVLPLTETMHKIKAMQRDTVWDLRESALLAMIDLAPYHDPRMAMRVPGRIQEIIEMLRDSNSCVQRAALNTIVTLAQHDDLRVAISSPETGRKLVAILADPRADVRKLGHETVVHLMQHDDVRARIPMREILQTIVATLRYPLCHHDVQEAGSTVVALAQYAEVRASISTSETPRILIRMLHDADLRVKDTAIEIIVSLAQYDDLLTVIPPMTRIMTMAGLHSSWVLRQAVLKLIIRLAHHARIRLEISTPEIMGSIVAMLMDVVWQIQQSALQAVVVLAQYADVRAAISAAGTFPLVITMLEDSNLTVRQAVRKAVIAFANYDELRTSMSAPGSVQRLIRALGNTHRGSPQELIALTINLLQYAEVRDLILTPDSLVDVLHILDGGPGDSDIIKLIRAIISLHGRVSFSDTALIDGIFERIGKGTPALRKSCVQLIKSLPLLDMTISLDNVEKLFEALGSPELDSVESAVQFVICFATNARFRQHMLKIDMWKVTIKLLQDPLMAPEALKIITALAQYDEARPMIIHSSSGIVHQLLTMLTPDLAGGYHLIGMKGLRALQLFKFQHEE